MKREIKLLVDSFFYGTMLGSMFVWLYTIGLAKQNDWVILMDFNMYGEGMLEYIYMLVWLIVAIYKLVEYIRYQFVKKETTIEIKVKNKKVEL